MAKRVFFSFHYQDVINFRANVVRNHWLLKEDREAAGFFDASIWEKTKKEGDLALKRLIHSGLDNTSNTCVLIGSETYKRPWVKYELFKSIDVGNNLFGIHINGIMSKDQKTKYLGKDPLDNLGLRFNDNGKVGYPIEFNGVNWVKYMEIDPIKFSSAMQSKYWNKAFKLSDFYSTYKWYEDDGYNEFSNWVK